MKLHLTTLVKWKSLDKEYAIVRLVEVFPTFYELA